MDINEIVTEGRLNRITAYLYKDNTLAYPCIYPELLAHYPNFYWERDKYDYSGVHKTWPQIRLSVTPLSKNLLYYGFHWWPEQSPGSGIHHMFYDKLLNIENKFKDLVLNPEANCHKSQAKYFAFSPSYKYFLRPNPSKLSESLETSIKWLEQQHFKFNKDSWSWSRFFAGPDSYFRVNISFDPLSLWGAKVCCLYNHIEVPYEIYFCDSTVSLWQRILEERDALFERLLKEFQRTLLSQKNRIDPVVYFD